VGKIFAPVNLKKEQEVYQKGRESIRNYQTQGPQQIPKTWELAEKTTSGKNRRRQKGIRAS